jgi:hypothetical protein
VQNKGKEKRLAPEILKIGYLAEAAEIAEIFKP